MNRRLRVITVLALGVCALAAYFYWSQQFHGARAVDAQALVQTLGHQVEDFHKHCGFYPSSAQGLEALRSKPTTEPLCPDWHGSYLTGELQDPWGNPYFYSSDTKMFDLRSFGRDARVGGEDEDADLVYTPFRN